MGRNARLDAKCLDQFLRQVMRVAGGETDPHHPGHLGHTKQQFGEGDAPTVAVDVLADESDLAHAYLHQAGDLLEDVGKGSTHLPAAGVRHHAEATDVVAALHRSDELAHFASR